MAESENLEPEVTEPAASNSSKVSRRNLLLGGGVAAGAAVVGGLGGYQAASWKGGDRVARVWKLGTIIPKDSRYLGEGQEISRGLELGVKVINDRGGISGREVQLVTEEVDDLSAEAMAAAVQALVAQEPAAVFLGFASAGAAEFGALAEYGAPVFHLAPSPATLPFSAAEDSNVFCAVPQDTYGPAFAGMLQNLTASGELATATKTCLIVVSDGPDGGALASSVEDSVRASGWTVLERLTNSAGKEGVDSLVDAVRLQAPAAVFLGIESPSDAAAFQTSFAKAASRSLIYAAFTPSVPEYLERTGESANGVVWSTPIGTITGTSTSARFEELFAKKNRKSQLGLSQAGAMFDLSLYWAQCAALAKSPSKSSAVGKIVSESVYRGVSGSLNFGDDRVALGYPTDTNDPGLGLPHLTFQIQGGKHVRLMPEIYRKGTFSTPSWF